ncbi:merozoite surface protein CMZ-8-like [Eupeodes corollae]|uniref:merozoite surface protein CMZ-8-like n=1 Tax=Eupeodes corollae TaxID=290404 RepID=UPI002493A5FD|nr:merozoite surface protein CMZ-8-like [Eupeodes corollae]
MKLLAINLLIFATFLALSQLVEKSNAEPLPSPTRTLHKLLKQWHDKHHHGGDDDDESHEDNDDNKKHGKHLMPYFPNNHDTTHSQPPTTSPTVVSQPPPTTIPHTPAVPSLPPVNPHPTTGPVSLPMAPHSNPAVQTQPPVGTGSPWYPPCAYLYPYPAHLYPTNGVMTGVAQSVSDETGIFGNGNTVKKLFDVGTTINIPIDIF